MFNKLSRRNVIKITSDVDKCTSDCDEHKGKVGVDWRAVFNRYDSDGDGSIPLVEFRDILLKSNIEHEIPRPALDKILNRADNDINGKLEYAEFVQLCTSPELSNRTRKIIKLAHNYAVQLVVPRNKQRKEYNKEYNCWPPPITIFILTLCQVIVFIYYSIDFGYAWMPGPVSQDSKFIYNPERRYEVWRYVTYMLIHAGGIHIYNNIFVQLLLGIPLEMVHKYWRVWLVYMSGVLAGSLLTSITNPSGFILGASSGVYALLTAHLATIIMNFQEMKSAKIQLFFLILVMLPEASFSIYTHFTSDNKGDRVGYSGHLAGAIAGILVGIVALRNLEEKKWEKPIWWISFILVTIFFLTMIIWNAAFPDYFLPSQWD